MRAVGKTGDYLHGMAEHDAIRFRRQAHEALGHADAAANLIDIKAWLLVAEDWLKLAQAVEVGLGCRHLLQTESECCSRQKLLQ